MILLLERKDKELNLLFLTLLDFHSLNEHNIYTDLLREFQKNGHRVYVSPRQSGEMVKKRELYKKKMQAY